MLKVGDKVVRHPKHRTSKGLTIYTVEDVEEGATYPLTVHNTQNGWSYLSKNSWVIRVC